MKIISGGQTGVDTAALNFAVKTGRSHGGWVQKGRTNEAGIIPSRFSGLVEAEDDIPETRTRLNVGASDATLIISDGSSSPGTAKTIQFASEMGAPLKHVSLAADLSTSAAEIRDWLNDIKPAVLNVAGPRESESPGIESKAGRLLELALSERE